MGFALINLLLNSLGAFFGRPFPKAFFLCVFLSLCSPAAALTCTPSPPSGAFGTIDVLPGTAINAASSFTVACTAGTAGQIIRLCIGISVGVNYAGSTTQRSLAGTSNGLTFDLFTDSARSTVWGSPGMTGVTAYPGTIVTYDLTLLTGGAATTPALNVYGQIYGAQQTAIPGSYTWTSQTPAVSYGVKTATACPTGATLTAASGTDTWTATIAAKCNLSATDINFGSVGLLTANVDATGTLNVQCTNTTPYTVSINGGLSAATDPTLRKMTLSTNSVTYGIYSDSTRTTAWGSLAGATIAGTGTGLTQSLTMYGRVPPQSPAPPPGNYSDTLIATVTY